MALLPFVFGGVKKPELSHLGWTEMDRDLLLALLPVPTIKEEQGLFWDNYRNQ